jgi:hypothetical protein
MDGVISMYKNFGYLTDGRRVNTKDMVLLEMAIEGVMYRYYGMDHPIHPIAENAITIEDELESENEQETDEESEDVNGNDTD